MAKISDTKLRSNLREKITKEIFETLADSGEEVMMTKSNQFCFTEIKHSVKTILILCIHFQH